MIALSVLYPKTDSSYFDHQYYIEKHIPLVRSKWSSLGLERIDLLRGTATVDGAPPAYELLGTLTFTSMEQVQDALANGTAVLADIPNFTNVQPLLQLNETVTS